MCMEVEVLCACVQLCGLLQQRSQQSGDHRRRQQRADGAQRSHLCQ